MNKLLGPVVVAIIAVLDQFTKWTVTENMFRHELGLGDPMRFMDWLQNAPERLGNVSITISSILNFTLVWNEGISFGLLQTGGWGVLTVLSLVISSFFFIWMLRANLLPEILGLALIVGGALGNVFDRIRFGAVVDYLDFYYQNLHFPAFNVADAAISVGVAVLIIQGLFFARKSD